MRARRWLGLVLIAAAVAATTGPGCRRGEGAPRSPTASSLGASPNAPALPAEGGLPARDIWCVDPVLADQLTSGGERLSTWTPCWTSERLAAERAREATAALDDLAARQAHTAAALREAELDACAAIAGAELEHTPFAHVEDIAAVERVVADDGELRGARIVFRPVPGLTATWMRAAITCHRARAGAAGWRPFDVIADPSLVEATAIEVRDEPRGVVVEVIADDPEAAALVVSRAERLLQPGAPAR